MKAENLSQADGRALRRIHRERLESTRQIKKLARDVSEAATIIELADRAKFVAPTSSVRDCIDHIESAMWDHINTLAHDLQNMARSL